MDGFGSKVEEIPPKGERSKTQPINQKGKLENSGPELNSWMTGVPSGEKAGTWCRSGGPLSPPQWVKAEPDGGKSRSQHFRVWGIHRPYKLPKRKAEDELQRPGARLL